MKKNLLLLTAISVFATALLSAQSSGNLTFERWSGLTGGTSIHLLKENGIATRSADSTILVSSSSIGENLGDHYGARLRGTITAPVTGHYTFFLSADDEGELWLSGNSSGMNKKRIAFLSQ